MQYLWQNKIPDFVLKSKELLSNINFAQVLIITSVILTTNLNYFIAKLTSHQFEIFLVYSFLEAFQSEESTLLELINLIYEKFQILYLLLQYNAPTFDFGSRNLNDAP